MIRPPCPETRALPRAASFPWLATLMLGTAIAAFAPAAGAQDTNASATEATGSAASDAVPAGDAATGGAAPSSDAAGGDAAAGSDAASGDTAASGDAASGGAAASGDIAASGEGGAAGGAAAPAGDTAASGDMAAGGTAASGAATGQFRQAAAPLRNAEGADIGTATITETASGAMYMILDITEGGVPAAQHGIHIHETGACEAPTFESAGGHLAGGKEHGVHSPNGMHAGDLPNITMGASGALHVEYFLPGVLMDQILDGDGSAVVIHAELDDYTTQPSGNSGDRIACGVLELSR